MRPGQPLRALGAASWLLVRAGQGLVPEAVAGDPLAEVRFAGALRTYAWHPLPVLAGLAGLVGLILGVAAARLLALYNVPLAVLPPLAGLLGRDLVPLLCGLFAAGRIAVELATRIAATALVNEIDALEVLGRDPVRHLLTPALAGVIVAVPLYVVTAWAGALGAMGLVLRLNGVSDWPSFLRIALSSASARAAAAGLAKTLLFALIAFAVGAEVGARGAEGPGRIGRRATAAFTTGLLAIFAADAGWTMLA